MTVFGVDPVPQGVLEYPCQARILFTPHGQACVRDIPAPILVWSEALRDGVGLGVGAGWLWPNPWRDTAICKPNLVRLWRIYILAGRRYTLLIPIMLEPFARLDRERCRQIGPDWH